MRGRPPSRITEGHIEVICKLIRDKQIKPYRAAMKAGIPQPTFQHWITRGKEVIEGLLENEDIAPDHMVYADFLIRVDEADVDSEIQMTDNLRQCIAAKMDGSTQLKMLQARYGTDWASPTSVTHVQKEAGKPPVFEMILTEKSAEG